MWVPRTWQEIVALLGEPETQVLDFKRDLPGKGKGADAANDVAAMTLSGGVLIYGLDEDKTTLEATTITKVPLAGAPEKLQSMVGANAAPAPYIETVVVKEKQGDADGVLVVAVPPSSQAPHMARGRYPVRRGATTEYLGELEVARLYERRGQVLGPPPTARDLLDDFRDPPSMWQGGASSLMEGQGVMRLLVRPQAESVAHPNAPWLGNSLDTAVQAARSATGSRLQVGSESEALAVLGAWEPVGTDGWTAGYMLRPQEVLLQKPAFAATLTYPLTLSFVGSWPLSVRGDAGRGVYKGAWEWKVAVELMACLSIAGEFAMQVPGAGPLACVLSLGGWKEALPFFATRGRPDVRPPGISPAPGSHVETALVAASDLRDAPEEVGRRLLARWLVPFYSARQELFASVLA